MQDSITIAEVGSIVKVSGSKMATPLGPPSPGSTPTKMPSTSPIIISASIFHVSSTAKPCINKPKASITKSQVFRHCEELSDEAIQPASLRSQRRILLASEGRFQRPFRHDDVE